MYVLQHVFILKDNEKDHKTNCLKGQLNFETAKQMSWYVNSYLIGLYS